MKEINISADDLIKKLLELSETEPICFLDSCGVNHLDSHLLIAGIKPLEVIELKHHDPEKTLFEFNRILLQETGCIFTISYDFGMKLENLSPKTSDEPDIFLATFDALLFHDYNLGQTYLEGNDEKFREVENLLSLKSEKSFNSNSHSAAEIRSNFTKYEYIKKIEEIQERIRKGDTYQTNLTQQFTAKLSDNLSPQQIYWNLKKDHPAPFASFIKRNDDYVVSISPERFVKIDDSTRTIKTSPIKGTRPKTDNENENLRQKDELLSSKKDRAENTMIVDLLRNDLGRVSEFGTVDVEKLCDLEEHPSLFHLVSTVKGTLRKETNFAQILKAIFPCGSITGCPKISTMQIIDELETTNRGLSMGAIGYKGFDKSLDINVAIRTMIIKNQKAIFNVGGGIVIDSDPAEEYNESLVKAKALFNAIGVKEF